jgi:hypothetical protein
VVLLRRWRRPTLAVIPTEAGIHAGAWRQAPGNPVGWIPGQARDDGEGVAGVGTGWKVSVFGWLGGYARWKRFVVLLRRWRRPTLPVIPAKAGIHAGAWWLPHGNPAGWIPGRASLARDDGAGVADAVQGWKAGAIARLGDYARRKSSARV